MPRARRPVPRRAAAAWRRCRPLSGRSARPSERYPPPARTRSARPKRAPGQCGRQWQLKNGNPKNYQVETTGSLAGLFEFKPVITPGAETSLKKVDAGRVDGLIYAQEVTDPLVKTLGLKRIVRSLYSLNDITFGLQKGQSGSVLD